MYQLPIYVKSSSIIPMQKSVQSTKDNAGDTLFVHIYNGDNSNAFDWYEDDGATMNYLKQDYCLRKIEFDPQKKQIRFESQEGKFKTSFHFVKFILHGFSESNPNFRLGEKSLAMNRTRIPVLDPLDLLASIYDPNYLQSLKAQRIAGEQVMITVPYVENGFVVSW